MELLLSLNQAPELTKSVNDLLFEHFPKGKDTRLTPSDVPQEFSLLYRGNEKQFFLICNSQKTEVLATAAFQTFEFKLPAPHKPLKMAAIGAVVTHPRHRGKGYSTKILNHIETQARQLDCEALILWSDLFSFYEKVGYFPAGAESTWTLTDESLKLLRVRLAAETPKQRDPALKISSFHKIEDIMSLYAQQKFGPHRPSSRWPQYDDLLALPHTFGFLVTYKDQNVGYAILGKGRDLFEVLHEIYIEPTYARMLLPEILKEALHHVQNSLRVQVPLNHPLEEELNHWMSSSVRNVVGLVKILAELREDLNPALLGPWRIREMDGLEESVRKQFAHQEPLPFYFWGLDSV